MDNILINKIAIIRSCLRQIEIYYRGFEHELAENFMRQDAIVLNLQRACEASIDLALRVIRIKQCGLPQESRDAFLILRKEQVLSGELADRLCKMVGFRNVAVHDYQKINLDVVRSILNTRLEDFERLIDAVEQHAMS